MSESFEEYVRVPLAEALRKIMYSQAKIMCKPTDIVFKADLWNESHPGEVPCEIPGTIYSCEFSWFRTQRAICQPRQTKICGNVKTLPFKNNVFDVVLDLSTIDHLAGPEYVIKEYSRVLKPGGKLFVSSWVGPCTLHILSDIALDQFLHDENLMDTYMKRYFSKVEKSTLLNSEESKGTWVGLPPESWVKMISWIGEKDDGTAQ